MTELAQTERLPLWTEGVPAIVVIDPDHEYAARFITVAQERLGLQTICLFTGRRERLSAARHFPLLGESAVLASHEIAGRSMADMARVLRARYRPVAVVPFSELVLSASCE